MRHAARASIPARRVAGHATQASGWQPAPPIEDAARAGAIGQWHTSCTEPCRENKEDDHGR